MCKFKKNNNLHVLIKCTLSFLAHRITFYKVIIAFYFFYLSQNIEIYNFYMRSKLNTKSAFILKIFIISQKIEHHLK